MRFSQFLSRTVALIALLAAPAVCLGLDSSTWIRTYAGGYGHSVYETADGGALLAGTYGAGGACCQPWLIKLAADGSVQWHITYDAPGLAGANNIVPTRDGGWLMSGEGIEFMLVKLDANGNVLWAKNYGDGGYTHMRVLEAGDGSILVTGATWLGDGGAQNGRALLLDPDGNVLWQNVFGQPLLPDYLTNATEAYNGNFIVVGSLRGSYWAMELDKGTGQAVWQNTYGGPFDDVALVVTKVMKNRYLVVGASESFNEGGFRNWWAVILNQSGKLWKEISLGGRDAEDPHTAIATSDGGFMIGGGTGSFGSGFSDIWLVKFDSRARVEWQKAYGLSGRTDSAWHIQETATGYAVIGDSYWFPVEYEIWLMTLDRDGNVANGQCGSVVDTTAVPWRTEASEIEGGAWTFNVGTKWSDMKVGATRQSFAIETCAPKP